jgi:hypothetical protein
VAHPPQESVVEAVRFRATCAMKAASGFVVMPAMWTARVAWCTTKRT